MKEKRHKIRSYKITVVVTSIEHHIWLCCVEVEKQLTEETIYIIRASLVRPISVLKMPDHFLLIARQIAHQNFAGQVGH